MKTRIIEKNTNTIKYGIINANGIVHYVTVYVQWQEILFGSQFQILPAATSSGRFVMEVRKNPFSPQS